MTSKPYDSGIYHGVVRHRRFTPTNNHFSYQLNMFAINPDEITELSEKNWLFGTKWFNPVRFNEKDYIKSELGLLKERIAKKIIALGGNWQGDKVLMLAQCRCLGLYFSPVNFYYCFDHDNICRLLLAEVSNTPWLERHYYLVDLTQQESLATVKNFHVSPFMNLAMQYHWRVAQPGKKLFMHIENHQQLKNTNSNDTVQTKNFEKLFDVTMALSKQPFSSVKLFVNTLTLPFSIVKIVGLIYWQALKLFIKRVPFVPYQNKRG